MSLNSALWIACDAAEAAVIGLLLYRRLWRNFPVFLLYLIQALAGDVGAAIVIHNDRSAYTICYLVQTVMDSILLFGVLIELAWSILRPIRSSLSRRAMIPIIGIILASGAAVWPFTALSALTGASQERPLIAHLQQTVSIMQIIFFLALIGGSQLLSIGWRDRELQIATGLGFLSFMSTAIVILQMHETSWARYRQIFSIEIGAYVCSLVYWVVSFSQKEAERRQFTPEMQRILLSVAGAAHATRVALNEPQTGKQRK